MKEAIKILNEMVADGVINDYAICEIPKGDAK